MILIAAPVGDAFAQKIREGTGETVALRRSLADAADLLPEADQLIADERLPEETLARCGKLKWLYSLSAGVEHLPFGALRAKGVFVSNASGIHGTQMAEQTLGVMILFSRQLHRALAFQRRKVWGRPQLAVGELAGRTLCVIGTGAIGREIARKAKAFDMRVTGLRRHPAPLPDFDAVLGMDAFHAALAEADYVVLVTPLTNETYHLMDAAAFACMKKTAVFLNVSRGDTVDEAALVEALRSGVIAGAGLDVFHEEPLPAASPLWEMENVVVTPHSAGLVPDYFDRAAALFIRNFIDLRAGRPVPNAVDLTLQY